MKTKNTDKKIYSAAEEAAAMVYPSSKKQQSEALQAFKEVRAQLSLLQSDESSRKNRLLQLKFMIEDYLASNELSKELFFGFFLKEYITRQSRKNNEFARDIDVNPTELSQVIRRHRKPTDKLIYRLEIHSNRNFPATVWFGLLNKERDCDLYYDRSIIDKEKKHVKRKLEFSL